MGDRTVFHIDMNNFYASVECLHRPEVRGRAVAVCGDPALRHGIVLAKNYPAKAAGVRTGQAIWEARQKCPDLVVLPPNYPLYLRYARMARAIYGDYTDQIEPFGLDEAWIDVTGSLPLLGESGPALADRIRARIHRELGVTASVGVSFNKVFAKLGSDYKKPDATTVITRENYQQILYPLPVEDLLYVGPATQRKLYDYGVYTIGQLAAMDLKWLQKWFGKWGYVLHEFARGLDSAPVAQLSESEAIKSVGNSTTTPRDLVCDEDVKVICFVMSESVAARLREHGLRCSTVQIHVRDSELLGYDRQGKLPCATNLSDEIAGQAMALFRQTHRWPRPIRSFGVRAADLEPENAGSQLSLLRDEQARIRRESLERTLDALRERFGHGCVQRALLAADRPLGVINPKEDHVIHPVGYFKGSVGSS